MALSRWRIRNDGVLHRLGDAVGGFVEENLEGFGVLNCASRGWRW